jgi:hypothetical protein
MTWNLFFSESLSFAGSREVGDNIHQIQGLSGGQIIVRATVQDAPPTWHLACKVEFLCPVPDFPNGGITSIFYGGRAFLNEYRILEVPATLNSPYSINLLIPYWYRQIDVSIWQRSTEFYT